ncbi:MAG: hypothetical protein BWX84_01927 [Verrucomicrobia bacterium ADurb.Bin118]|nr:MAG: hypothetical protein BWX84_01927 [Verrucomicrobia bacterium ADurb.Bin118]
MGVEEMTMLFVSLFSRMALSASTVTTSQRSPAAVAGRMTRPVCERAAVAPSRLVAVNVPSVTAPAPAELVANCTRDFHAAVTLPGPWLVTVQVRLNGWPTGAVAGAMMPDAVRSGRKTVS